MDVAVVGAGFAGMAAAVRLAEAGKRVALIEKRSTLGGRVHSHRDVKTGDVIDNGPHLFVGAYHHARRLLRALGTECEMMFQPRCDIRLRDEQGEIVFRHRALPGDLGLAAGFGGMRGVSLSDVWKSRRLLPAARNANMHALDNVTCEDWFQSLGVPRSVRRLFLDPVTIACVNDHPGKSSAALMARVLAQAFSGSPANGGLGFIRGPHSLLFEGVLERLLESKGGCILSGKRAEKVLFDQDRANGVELSDGSLISAADVIVAVPHRHVPSLLVESRAQHRVVTDIASLGAVPIVNIHLWLDRPVVHHPLVGLVEKKTQWVFALDHIWKEPGSPNRIVGVISGASDEAMMSNDELVEQMMRDLRDVCPAAKGAEVRHALVIKERESTMAPAPGSLAKRPGSKSPWPNLWWAGDWTNTGLPSTIEGACQSGHEAAEELLGL